MFFSHCPFSPLPATSLGLGVWSFPQPPLTLPCSCYCSQVEGSGTAPPEMGVFVSVPNHPFCKADASLECACLHQACQGHPPGSTGFSPSSLKNLVFFLLICYLLPGSRVIDCLKVVSLPFLLDWKLLRASSSLSALPLLGPLQNHEWTPGWVSCSLGLEK